MKMKYLQMANEQILALLMRMLWAAMLALPAFGAQGGVIYTNLHSFDNTDGAYPYAGLVQGSDGNFYGTTFGGGTNNYGTVFRLAIVPPPQLTLIPSGPYVILTWPTNASRFTLQSTTNLRSSVIWSTNFPAPSLSAGSTP